jgi:hypothetical protein
MGNLTVMAGLDPAISTQFGQCPRRTDLPSGRTPHPRAGMAGSSPAMTECATPSGRENPTHG